MICFPNAKINLGLYVLNKREDGYHNLLTCFYPVFRLTDMLEIVPSSQENPTDTLSLSGIPVKGDPEKNLVLKALHQIRASSTKDIPAMKIHLHKQIPSEAGLGGGSSDGTFMLKALNEYFRLEFSEKTLKDLALNLGSDCPFFLFNRPAIASKRGEVLQEITLSLKGYHILMIHPGIAISTKDAFSEVRKEQISENSFIELLQKGPKAWKGVLLNSFEYSAFKRHQELSEIKDSLYESGAIYASMSGSGSSLYGIYESDPGKLKDLPASYKQTTFLCMS